MATLTSSIYVAAPVEEVFDYALDPRKLWAVPDVALAQVELTPEGTGSSARVWSHFFGFHLEGGLEYTKVVRPERIVIDVGFAMEHPTWTFEFEPDDAGTKVTAQGEWHVSIPAVGRQFEQMLVKGHEEFVETMLATMKAEMEATTQAKAG
jgi:uncharacterized protein YndB with AHSA1/START domain